MDTRTPWSILDSHFGSRYKPQPVSTNLLQQVTCQHDSYQDLMPTVSYQRIPGAKTEAPKQPKKQDETEAPPGWNRSRQGPDKGPKGHQQTKRKMTLTGSRLFAKHYRDDREDRLNIPETWRQLWLPKTWATCRRRSWR